MLKTSSKATGNQSLSIVDQVQQGTPLPSQDFALSKVSSGSSSKDPTSPTQESFQASSFGDSALAVRHEFKPQVLTRRPKNANCKKGTPPVKLPILNIPLTDLHEKRETEQIKVEPPNEAKFQMPTYSSGNNEEYLVHVIAVLRLVKQKGTAAKDKEAFTALVKVRKEMSPLFNFPKDETAAKKEARKKKLSNLNESLKAKKSFAVNQAQKAYKLFSCFVIGVAQMQWDRIVNKMHMKNPWIGMNGKSNKGICMKSWVSFMDCIKLHKLTVFPADAAEKQHYYMQQTFKKPQRVMARQFVSHMGVLNDYLAYLHTVFNLSWPLQVPRR